MPKIFEIFSYPVTDTSAEAQQARSRAQCAFMARDCDGGGNRYLSDVDVTKSAELQALFPDRETVRAGVCSIRLTLGGSPWIVCPRRLLALNRQARAAETHQESAEGRVLQLLAYPVGTRLGVWSEVKISFKEEVDGATKRFDYTLDYVVAPLGRASQEQIEDATGGRWGRAMRTRLEKSGYTIAQRDGRFYVENFPIGSPSIIEIMTSSTSGGNKNRRTTIPMAFEDAILGREHNAPGINFRQVWARMVSQLIVKSEVALGWGGRTIWIVQDVLVDYICSSTALDVRRFLAQHMGEVNMLSLTFGHDELSRVGITELQVDGFFAGPMSANEQAEASFADMVRAPLKPELWRLLRILAMKRPVNQVIVTAPGEARIAES